VRYRGRVNSTLLHTLYVAVPLGLTAVLAAMVYSRKGNHPDTYSMSEPWTYGPVLWAATDEIVGHGHSGHGEHGGEHGAPTQSVGGGASGRW
jgi:uncharacterized membrane protein YgcG